MSESEEKEASRNLDAIPICSKEADVTATTLSHLKKRLQLDRLLPVLTAGVISGTVTIITDVSLGVLVFSTALPGAVSVGAGVFIFGTMAMALVTALTSSYSGSFSACQDSPAAILALMASAVVVQSSGFVAPDSVLATVLATIMLTTAVSGLFFLLLGTFKLGNLVRYIPYPVVGGFLAGTGWLLLSGGLGVMTDVPFTLAQLPVLVRPAMLLQWGPGFLFAVALTLVLRKYDHFLVIPVALLAAMGGFYLVLGLTGTSISEARAGGWLLGAFPRGNLWQPLVPTALARVDWRIVLGQMGNMVVIALIGAVSLLLNASGIELLVKRDVDLNRELRVAGLASLVTAVGSGPPGHTTLSLTALGHRIGADSRWVGVVGSMLCGAALLGGAQVIALFPRPVLGSVLCFTGLDFLANWVYDARSRLPVFDYLIVIAILIVMATVGVLEGVGLGLVLAVVVFVVSYSRIDVVRRTLCGRTCHSVVERPRLHRQLLRHKGEWLYIFELQGYVFFGTANGLLERIRERLAARGGGMGGSQPRTRFIILDFLRVTGLDTSAVMSFVKIKQTVQAHGVVLLFSHLPPVIQRQLAREVFIGEDQASCRVLADLDHAVEWCEEEMIKTFDNVGLVPRRRGERQARRSSPAAERLVHLLASLADDAPALPGAEPSGFPISDLAPYLERRDVESGEVLIRQGTLSQGLYFLESGQLTIETQDEGGARVRLRKVHAGTIVGEIATYMGGEVTATVLAECASTVYYLSLENLQRIEASDPRTAAVFHRSIARLLSERLALATETLREL